MMNTMKTMRRMMTRMKMRMSKRLAAVAALILLGCAASLYAQGTVAQSAAQSAPQGESIPKKNDYALIFISVFDGKGLSLYGVPVKIRRSQEKRSRWEGYSDHRGEFAQRVPVGKMEYIIWADLKDKAAAKRSEVKVNIENNERQDVSLHLD